MKDRVFNYIGTCNSSGFGLALGCEKKVDDKTRYCRKLHDYHLQFILQSGHPDKQDRVCWWAKLVERNVDSGLFVRHGKSNHMADFRFSAGFELIDCILESGSDTNCTEVSKELAAPEKVFQNVSFCLTYARANCSKFWEIGFQW